MPPIGNYDRDEVLIYIIKELLKNGYFTYKMITDRFPNISTSQYNRLTTKLRQLGYVKKEYKKKTCYYIKTEKFDRLFGDGNGQNN